MAEKFKIDAKDMHGNPVVYRDGRAGVVLNGCTDEYADYLVRCLNAGYSIVEAQMQKAKVATPAPGQKGEA